jgi:hypothetical protein
MLVLEVVLLAIVSELRLRMVEEEVVLQRLEALALARLEVTLADIPQHPQHRRLLYQAPLDLNEKEASRSVLRNTSEHGKLR